MHLIRNSLRFCTWKDRKVVTAALRPIYTAINEEAALRALEEFEARFGDTYGGIVKLWRDAWDRFVPFLAYPPEVRKVIYTTNMIESINFQLRKATKHRGAFPSERSAIKMLYLGIRNIRPERGGDVGTGTPGWNRALNALAIHFPGRLILD